MFDRVIVQQGRTEYVQVPYEKTVKRESTQQDLLALDDLQNRVLDRVIGTVTALDGALRAVIFDDPRTMTQRIRGTCHIVGHPPVTKEDSLPEREAGIDKLQKEVCEFLRALATEALVGAGVTDDNIYVDRGGRRAKK